MKKIIGICGLILIVLMFSGFSWYYSTKTAVVVPYKIKINGTDLDLYSSIVTINDHTYVPLRELAEDYGATVEWNEKEKEISVEFDQSPIPFKKDELWGLVNVNHKVVLEPKYTIMSKFSEGLAKVNRMGSYGYINESGEEVIPCIYYAANDFSDGFALVSEADENGINDDLGYKCYYYIDKNGNNIFGKRYKFGSTFSEGYAAVVTDGEIYPEYAEWYPPQWEFIDTTGKIVSKEKYEDTYRFKNGYAVVKKDGIWKVIDKAFECVQNLEFQNEDDAFEFAKELRAK